MKVANLAEAHGLPVTSHGAHDIHVHLLAAAPNAAYLEVHGFGLEKYMAHSLEMRDGWPSHQNVLDTVLNLTGMHLSALRLIEIY